MDAALVEKITRLILSKLEEYSETSIQKGVSNWKEKSHSIDNPEVLPLTEEELEKWKEISSSMSFTNRIVEEHSHLVPLTMEELNIWTKISSSLRFKEPSLNKA